MCLTSMFELYQEALLYYQVYLDVISLTSKYSGHSIYICECVDL